MADSNAPEHTDRGLFGLFGKKEEKPDQHVQQEPHSVDPPATHTPAYTGQEAGGNGYDGEVHHALPSALAHQIEHHAEEKKADEHVQHQSHSVDPHATHPPSYTADVHHAPPPAVSHQTQQFGQEEGENKQHQGLMGKLHRTNSSSSSSSSDEEEGGDKKEGRKKKGAKDKVKEKRADHSGDKQEEHEKKGLMEKIKEKLPGHRKDEGKAH